MVLIRHHCVEFHISVTVSVCCEGSVLMNPILQHTEENSTSNKFTAPLTLYVGIPTGIHIFHLILVVSAEVNTFTKSY